MLKHRMRIKETSYVYVVDKNGNPLMPTSRFGKVRRLLKTGEAVVIKRTPFTIKLVNRVGGYTQDVTLAIDPGSKKVGLSATTKEKELYAGELTLRTDVVDLLSTRRANRRARRNRKTRYRKPRYLNRTKSNPEGRLAPSIRQRIASHLQVIRQITEILPITKIIVEIAQFDVQKIKNPDIQGEGYQEGDMLGFWNVREYVFFRDGHTCQHCKGKSGDKILNVHHIESRKTGGDTPGNLITLCETCHGKHHKGEITVSAKRGASFRDAAFMGIMRWSLYNELKAEYPNVGMTYGYITKNVRIQNGLSKDHAVDARCISGNPNALPTDTVFIMRATRKHNRQIHKCTINKGGKRKLNQSPKYVFGYQLFDKVALADGREGFIFGRRLSGSFAIRTLAGEILSAGISYKKLKLKEVRQTILCERTRRAA
jgi:N6-L-threonylcarbamoyladenine synthase